MDYSGDLSQICQVLYDRLKCIFCGNHVRAGKYRWYKCFNGKHQICEDCKETKSKCCGMLISKYCEMTEELLKIKSIGFKCMNTSRGCQEIHGEEAMITHEAECIYRLVTCPNLECQDDVSFHELLEHLEQDYDFVTLELSNHKIVKEKSDFFGAHSYAYSLGDFYFTLYKIVMGNRVFIFNGDKDRHNNTFYLWVQMVGSKFEAKNYYYTLEFHGIDSNIKNHYFGQVVPIDETLESIKETKKYFGIDFDMFKAQFLDEDHNFEFSISIKNMKEEVKDDNEESGISDDE